MAAQMPTSPVTPLQAKKLVAQLGLDPNAYGSTARGEWTNQALADALGVNIIKSGSTGGRTLATPTAMQPAPTSEDVLANATKLGDTQYRMMQSPFSYLTDKGKEEFTSYTAPRIQEQLQSKAEPLGLTLQQLNDAYGVGQQNAYKADQDFMEWKRKNSGMEIPTWFKVASALAGAHMVGKGFMDAAASNLAPSAVGAGATTGGAAVPVFNTPFTAQQLGQIGSAAIGSYNNPQRGGATSMVNTLFPNPLKNAPGLPDLEIFQKAKKSFGLDNVQPFAGGGKYESEARQSFPREALSALRKIYGEGASNLESLLRGSVAAVPGVVGDIESLFRDSDKTRKFATTEEVLRDYMPRRFLSPTKEASGFEQVGTFVPLPIPTGTVSKGAELIKQGAKAAAPYAARSAVNLAEKYGVAPTMSVVKPKGGNWLAGSIEEMTQPLKVDPDAEALAALRRLNVDVPERRLREFIGAPPVPPFQAAVNNWIDTKLNKYIRNEMATPEDPIRALAERDILHVNPTNLTFGRQTPFTNQLAKSDTAKQWETATDYALLSETPEGIKRTADYAVDLGSRVAAKDKIAANPWLEKIDPSTPVYETSFRGGEPRYLGFDHLLDELRAAVDPASTLPQNLRYTLKDLEKVTVPQAVERVAKINEWRAKEAARAEKEGMMANLQAQPRLADENLQLSFVEKPGGTWVDIPETVNDEGMKLCSSIGKAGGWCTQHEWAAKDYGSGVNRLTALVDAEGRPHAQAKITSISDDYNSWPDDVRQKVFDRAKELWQKKYKAQDPQGDMFGLAQEEAINLMKSSGELNLDVLMAAPDITELKPVGNSFSSERAQEYIKRDPQYKQKVTDSVLKFLNSGNWGNVKDLHHYNIVDIVPDSDLGQRIKAAGVNVPRFVTHKQLSELLDRYGRTTLPSSPEGFAAGGLVGYDPEEIDRLVQSTLQGYAEGGKAKVEDDTPNVLQLTRYAEQLSRDMYPAQQGQYDQQDAARHMLAAGTLARKYNPTVAELLGKMHEYKTSPIAALKTLFGGKMPPDFDQDIHNNALGIELAKRAKTQTELEDLVNRYAESAKKERKEGAPWIGKQSRKYAAGGLVNYDPNEIDTIVSQLNEEFYG